MYNNMLGAFAPPPSPKARVAKYFGTLAPTTASKELLAPRSQSWSLWRLGGWCEWNTPTILEQPGLATIRYAVMHEWTVPVSFLESLTTLSFAPRHLADLATWNYPICVTVENLPKSIHVRRMYKVYESISQARMGLKIDRKIKEVVKTGKTFVV